MRPFEALLLVAMALAILRAVAAWRGRPWRSWSLTILPALAVLLALHLGVEGWRAQMLPAYVAIALLIGPSIIPAVTPWACAAGLLLITLAAGLAVARPVVTTPVPRGPLPVGTLSLEASPRAPRLWIWYPAQPESHPRYAPYRREARAPDRRASMGRTQSMLDAALAAAPRRLPVLVFFPGWGTLPSSNTVLLQDLASNGFVVVAVDAWDPTDYPDAAAAAADLAVPLVFDSDREADIAMAAGARNAVRQASLARRVLSKVDALDRDPAGMFAGRLALDRIGMLGFSFGGSIALQTALDDPRVRAVANLDGGVFTDAYRRGFDQPYLLLSEPPVTPAILASSDLSARREGVLDLEDEAALHGFLDTHGGIRAIISGAEHGNFTDAPLVTSLRRHGGTIDARRARAIIDDLLLAFFDTHLRDATRPDPAVLRHTYPELTLQLWPARITR